MRKYIIIFIFTYISNCSNGTIIRKDAMKVLENSNASIIKQYEYSLISNILMTDRTLIIEANELCSPIRPIIITMERSEVDSLISRLTFSIFYRKTKLYISCEK
jgi:hypothetical protein